MGLGAFSPLVVLGAFSPLRCRDVASRSSMNLTALWMMTAIDRTPGDVLACLANGVDAVAQAGGGSPNVRLDGNLVGAVQPGRLVVESCLTVKSRTDSRVEAGSLFCANYPQYALWIPRCNKFAYVRDRLRLRLIAPYGAADAESLILGLRLRACSREPVLLQKKAILKIRLERPSLETRASISSTQKNILHFC